MGEASSLPVSLRSQGSFWWGTPQFKILSNVLIYKSKCAFASTGTPPNMSFKRKKKIITVNVLLARVLSRFSRVWLCATLWTVAASLLCPWSSPGKNTGLGCHALLTGTQKVTLTVLRFYWLHSSYWLPCGTYRNMNLRRPFHFTYRRRRNCSDTIYMEWFFIYICWHSSRVISYPLSLLLLPKLFPIHSSLSATPLFWIPACLKFIVECFGTACI